MVDFVTLFTTQTANANSPEFRANLNEVGSEDYLDQEGNHIYTRSDGTHVQKAVFKVYEGDVGDIITIDQEHENYISGLVDEGYLEII